ncbi:integrin-linked protein kinase homolog pat-4 [Hyalella azteca]|uniref:Integrin-linked protein kinase homolog pat-4 n=1 Tax=Hyalella azteca TaxID=294128 RepID=A0A8B7P1H3_HYAAZ|nr:integrin-linked protein kinase homolog pat-4 [Hyalella azteca]XP_018019874.1 integrin-linked protein kinase homolog pat-4 [Hyalella azteca]
MDDIFHWCREGNMLQVRMWLDDTEHDLNQGDDHGFSLLHWAAKEGQMNVVELLLSRGCRVSPTNLGDDTPLHLAAAHDHRDIVCTLLRHRAEVNKVNEHGNTALHYACFWGYENIAEDLIDADASVAIANKYGDVPLDKCKGSMAKRLHSLAVQNGQKLERVAFKDQSWLGLKTRSRDATLSRHKGINIQDLSLQLKIADTPSGEMWRGRWQNNDIVAKILRLREVTDRICRDFNDEFPKLRIFSHPNVLPVVGCCNSPPNLVVITQYLQYGSLFNVLHQSDGNIVLDTSQALKWALDITKGMAFIHSLNKIVPNLYLSSKHVMIDDDLTAKISMADAKFTFQEKGKIYSPQWFAPEALVKKQKDLNIKAADMWSFAIVLWEMATREVPFADLSPMEAGMKIATEGLRVSLPPGLSPHICKLINISMNEEPGKRPSFDMLQPILEKMCSQ